jgi:hypothetical protein
MIGFLRIVRGVAGFLFAMQVVGVMPALFSVADNDGTTQALLAIKFVAGAIFFVLFTWLRGVINARHLAKAPMEPILLRSTWAL